MAGVKQDGWELVGPDGRILGRLASPESDMFVSSCSFEPTDYFSDVAPIFAEELRCLNAIDESPDGLDALESMIAQVMALGLELRPLSGGEPLREYLLHIDLPAREAWFRS